MSLQPSYLSKEALESKAEQLLSDYLGGHHLRSRQALDIDSFAEFFLGANIDYQRLPLDDSVLGMSIFQPLLMSLSRPSGGVVDVVFPGQTILIDSDALADSPESRLRFTLAHECSHLILHKHIYYRDPAMKCSSNNGYQPFTTASESARSDKLDRAEFQANYLGAALLMPREPFTDTFNHFVPHGWYSLNDFGKREAVTKIAATFGVSLQATAIRIKNLKLAG